MYADSARSRAWVLKKRTERRPDALVVLGLTMPARRAASPAPAAAATAAARPVVENARDDDNDGVPTHAKRRMMPCARVRTLPCLLRSRMTAHLRRTSHSFVLPLFICLTCAVDVDLHPIGIILKSQPSVKGVRFSISKEHWAGKPVYGSLPAQVIGCVVRVPRT